VTYNDLQKKYIVEKEKKKIGGPLKLMAPDGGSTFTEDKVLYGPPAHVPRE
jgi:hypothetical protein